MWDCRKGANAPERKGEGKIFEAARFPAHIASANITTCALSISKSKIGSSVSIITTLILMSYPARFKVMSAIYDRLVIPILVN